MSHLKRRGVLALLGLVLIGTMASCALFGNEHGFVSPEVSLVDLGPLPSEGFEQRFAVTLRVVNPNEIPLASDGLDLILEMNGRRLARALSDESFIVPRMGERLVTLVATTNLIDLFRQVVRLPEAGRLDYTLRGRVLLSGSAGWLRFERKGTLLPE
jgi:LEA14-like dessication related protein